MATSSKNLRFDVIIAGGGFAGLTMARALSVSLGSSARIAVVDRAAMTPAQFGPKEASPAGAGNDARASALAAGVKQMLDVLGIWTDLADGAQPVHDIEITDSSLDDARRPSVLNYDNAIANGDPGSYIVENSDLQRALAKAVSSDRTITILGGHDVEGYTADENSVQIHLKDGSILTAALLVAADGRASRLRQAAGIKTINWDHGQVGIVTKVTHDKPHHSRAIQHFLPAGPFAILPLKGNRSCITWSEDAVRGREIMAMDDDDFLAEVRKRFGARLGEIALDAPRGSWPLSTQLARSYIARRLVLVGDAAHGMHPIAGQGFNLAMRDVAALTQVLTESARLGIDLGGGDALERYERWRRFDSTVSAGAFAGLNGLFSNDSMLARTVRDAGLGIVDRLPGLKKMLVREAAGLSGDVPRLLKGEMV